MKAYLCLGALETWNAFVLLAALTFCTHVADNTIIDCFKGKESALDISNKRPSVRLKLLLLLKQQSLQEFWIIIRVSGDYQRHLWAKTGIKGTLLLQGLNNWRNRNGLHFHTGNRVFPLDECWRTGYRLWSFPTSLAHFILYSFPDSL